MKRVCETLLPDDVQAAACRRDNEWGWPPALIPWVIDEAEKLGLLSVGGQLQFLLPEGTCECYWVSVDPLLREPDGLDWHKRVAFAATNARSQFAGLSERFDFVAEGRKSFGAYFDAYESVGGDPAECMCFIWYLEAEQAA